MSIRKIYGYRIVFSYNEKVTEIKQIHAQAIYYFYQTIFILWYPNQWLIFGKKGISRSQPSPLLRRKNKGLKVMNDLL